MDDLPKICIRLVCHVEHDTYLVLEELAKAQGKTLQDYANECLESVVTRGAAAITRERFRAGDKAALQVIDGGNNNGNGAA